MSSSDAENIARDLASKGWTVEQERRGQWTAQHPDTTKTIRWKRGVRTQRILDEVETALKLQPHRTTNGQNRKAKQARARELAAKEVERQLSREEARTLAVHDVFLVHQAETSVLPDALKRRYDDLSLSTTLTAVRNADKHGITGQQIQRALVHPFSVLKGTNSCAVYVGDKCTVVVSALGSIVSVKPIK